MANIEELITKARVIRNETGAKQNTALRVGNLLLDIINAIADNEINITVTSGGQHIWTVGNNQYLLTPYTEEATVVSTEYGKPVVQSITYSGNVSNEGVAATVTAINFKQLVTKNWSNGTTTSEWVSGTLSTSGVTFSYGISNAQNGAAVAANGSVTANPSTSGSIGVIAVITPQVTWNGQTSENESVSASVSQAAATCSLSPTTKSVSADQNSFDVTINRSSGVDITGVTGSTGVTPTLNAAKTKVTVAVAANTNTSSRTMTVTVYTSLGSKTVTITQAAAVITYYAYYGTSAAAPSSVDTSNSQVLSGTTTVNITTATSDKKKCHWVAFLTASGYNVTAVKDVDGDDISSSCTSTTIGDYTLVAMVSAAYIGNTTKFTLTK